MIEVEIIGAQLHVMGFLVGLSLGALASEAVHRMANRVIDDIADE